MPPNAPYRHGGYVAIEIKRRAGIDAVDQLLRYLEYLRHDPMIRGNVRGILVGQVVSPQAKTYAHDKGIATIEVDYDALRGLPSNDLRLF